jgi:hypothetical protein
LAERIQKVFGNNIEWVSITEMAQRSAVAAKM